MSLPVLLLARRLVNLHPSVSKALPKPFSTSNIQAGYWNHDWRPDTKIPKTVEEKRAAAKKYGLIPADYRPYPEDGTGVGDYPMLPPVSAESRNQNALFDMPELKRNFGEPLHIDADLYGEDRWNINARYYITPNQMLFVFLGYMSVFLFLFWVGQHIRICALRCMPKHYAHDGKKHYSFELE